MLAAFAVLHFIRPAPPDTLTIAAGVEGSRFHTVALRYQKILARSGVRLKVLATEGSLDNLNRLLVDGSGIDVALVQSGLADPVHASELISLGSVFYVPLTIFYRNPHPIERLSELRGHRIAVGPPGSGTRALALTLLKANELGADPKTPLVELEGADARAALLKGDVEAIFLAGDSASSEVIIEMLHAPGVRLFDFPQADAYVRRFRYLNKLDLPPGAFDLGENLPPLHITMLAPTVELVARPGLHPALSDLLIEAATEVHGGASLLQEAGQFPAPVAHDFRISEDAARYYKSGKSIAYRYFPFWLATLLDRAVVVLLPTLLVVIPVIRYIPELYNWSIQRRINRRYLQLMALERESLASPSDEHRAELRERLADIEKAVIALKLPGSHAIQIYQLRQHMQFVRNNLQPTSAGGSATRSRFLAAACGRRDGPPPRDPRGDRKYRDADQPDRGLDRQHRAGTPARLGPAVDERHVADRQVRQRREHFPFGRGRTLADRLERHGRPGREAQRVHERIQAGEYHVHRLGTGRSRHRERGQREQCAESRIGRLPGQTVGQPAAQKHPAAAIRPLNAPVTRATASAPVCQSPATADHRFEAAPALSGRKQISIPRAPERERATAHRSPRTPTRSWPRCRARGSGGGSRSLDSAAPQARQRPAITAPDIHGAGRCCAIHRPAPPPMPDPPRLPAIIHPLARPFWPSGVSQAIRLHVVMPISVEAMFAASTSTYITGSIPAVGGRMLISRMPAALIVQPIQYQVLRVRRVSISGAQKNFSVCGISEEPMSPAISTTGSPDCDSRYAVATPT